jgi:hypothetical protein
MAASMRKRGSRYWYSVPGMLKKSALVLGVVKVVFIYTARRKSRMNGHQENRAIE